MILIRLIRVSCADPEKFFRRGDNLVFHGWGYDAYFRKFQYVNLINLSFSGRDVAEKNTN